MLASPYLAAELLPLLVGGSGVVAVASLEGVDSQDQDVGARVWAAGGGVGEGEEARRAVVMPRARQLPAWPASIVSTIVAVTWVQSSS